MLRLCGTIRLKGKPGSKFLVVSKNQRERKPIAVLESIVILGTIATKIFNLQT